MSWVVTATATPSAVSSVSIDNCFSATYQHYLLLTKLSCTSANAAAAVRLRAAGTDNTSTQYRRQYGQGSSSTVGGALTTGETSWPYAAGELQTDPYQISYTRISYPFAATETVGAQEIGIALSGNIDLFRQAYHNTATTSYDGITVSVAAGTMTGTIKVFGLRES